MAFRFVDDRGAAGFSWLVEEPMTRTSHALAAGGRVWLVDPVDWPPAIERALGLGEPTGVVQLLDRHNRDCADVANELGVPHLRVPSDLPDSPFAVLPVVSKPKWSEVALWWEEARTLVVAEALGANPFFTVDGDRLGVHGLLKPFPPRRRFAGLTPVHILVGHGVGVHGPDAAPQLGRALDRSRLRFLGWLAGIPRANRRAAQYLRELDRDTA